MKYNIQDIAEYIVAMVSEFAARHKLLDSQAFRYLDFHRGISFIEDHYGIIHTLDFDEALESVTLYCRNAGGKL